jgi:hypothetical protein
MIDISLVHYLFVDMDITDIFTLDDVHTLVIREIVFFRLAYIPPSIEVLPRHSDTHILIGGAYQ